MERRKIVIIGSSAGGPHVLGEIFRGMPKLRASLILIQHMPRFINQSLCDHLRAETEMTVKMAEHKEGLEPGVLYVAPSEIHIKIALNERILLERGDKVNFVCPSIDVAMMSLRPDPEVQFMGIILTGMGRDGAKGISHIKKLGGITIAQDKESSVIFGMPDEAIQTGHVDWILNPSRIRDKMIASTGWDRKKYL
ncbi:chemotaxis protein CheB [bacterium]|nr:chemotaxis protein CheB [bacterium]